MQHEKFHSAPGSRVGTPAYLAPEVIMTTKGQTYDGKVFPPSLVPHKWTFCMHYETHSKANHEDSYLH